MIFDILYKLHINWALCACASCAFNTNQLPHVSIMHDTQSARNTFKRTHSIRIRHQLSIMHCECEYKEFVNAQKHAFANEIFRIVRQRARRMFA